MEIDLEKTWTWIKSQLPTDWRILLGSGLLILGAAFSGPALLCLVTGGTLLAFSALDRK